MIYCSVSPQSSSLEAILNNSSFQKSNPGLSVNHYSLITENSSFPIPATLSISPYLFGTLFLPIWHSLRPIFPILSLSISYLFVIHSLSFHQFPRNHITFPIYPIFPIPSTLLTSVSDRKGISFSTIKKLLGNRLSQNLNKVPSTESISLRLSFPLCP